jgi:hypothetical protein
MQGFVRQPWVRLDMSAPEQDPGSNFIDTSIRVSYVDSLGQHASPVHDPTAESLLVADQWVYWPRAASMLLLSHLANHPTGRYMSPLGATPLAVLYTPPDLDALPTSYRVDEDGAWIQPGRIADRWEAVLSNLLGAIGANPDRLELVRLGRRARHAHGSFRLPLRIAVVGADSERLAGWLRAEPAFGVRDQESILRYGLEIAYPGDMPSRATLAGWDIVLLRDRDDVGAIAGRLARLNIDSRPRLMVLMRSERDPHRQDREPRYRSDLPPGVASLYIDGGDDYECLRLLTAFIQALMHDLPLHQAVATARRDETVSRLNAGMWSITLSATEQSLDSLRMMDAYIDLQHQTFDLMTKGAIGQPAELGRHGRAPIVQRNALRLQRFADLTAGATRAVDDVATAYFSFHHESDGLWPIAGYLAEVEAASAALDTPHAELAQLREDPDLTAALASEQERHVSVWMTAMFDDGPSAVRPDAAGLVADQVYLLNAAIGVHWPTNLVESSTPPIDPLLPPLAGDESYQLQFVLFSMDFTALSDTVIDVILPQHGASDLASFLIRSPVLPTETAELRLILYHNNNVLQTFHLTAQVDTTARPTSPGVVVRMDFSQANFFRDVAETRPRFLSIASNEDESGTHRLFVNGAVATTVPISEASGREVIDRFRELLSRAAESNRDEKALWDLAQLGSRIYNQLLIDVDTKAFEDHLKTLQMRRGEVIQVIRLAANFPYPWPIVYDWMLPEDPSPMCTGSCEHSFANDVFCVNGFWGARLIVEEFIKDKNVQRTLSVRSGQGQPTCIVTVGKRASDKYTRDLVDHLMTADAPFATVEADLAHSVLERMWDDTSRPAILVVIGHTAAGRDSFPSIAIDTIDHAISSQSVMRFVRKATHPRWIDPKTFIFLMACDSASTDLEHLSDVMTSFVTAGAGAVVGAEVKVSTLEVRDFLTTIFTELAQGRSLGESVSAFRLGRLRERHPDAFSFNAFGSADAHLALT